METNCAVSTKVGGIRDAIAQLGDAGLHYVRVDYARVYGGSGGTHFQGQVDLGFALQVMQLRLDQVLAELSEHGISTRVFLRLSPPQRNQSACTILALQVNVREGFVAEALIITSVQANSLSKCRAGFVNSDITLCIVKKC